MRSWPSVPWQSEKSITGRTASRSSEAQAPQQLQLAVAAEASSTSLITRFGAEAPGLAAQPGRQSLSGGDIKALRPPGRLDGVRRPRSSSTEQQPGLRRGPLFKLVPLDAVFCLRKKCPLTASCCRSWGEGRGTVLAHEPEATCWESHPVGLRGKAQMAGTFSRSTRWPRSRAGEPTAQAGGPLPPARGKNRWPTKTRWSIRLTEEIAPPGF